ncbi:Y-family DNA polymerase [Marilutibacter alkalisoli]|uniref:DNA polymerase Y family protein n=1 Tax=Marilutibacter alkalisoli TaxID=2591633 RepID=A0A514BRI2_9GAMM|nr:DNA polymerase Y family protein [Lysobacter alkalisoli]QDH69981.1 DNA polymerase Y family protein [Lysobacter alkalisoli]
MRWACILLPQLALDGVLRRCAQPDAPLAMVAGSQQRRVLHALNPAARALGLRRGMALTAAQALARGFATVEHDPDDEARWHRFLAAWAYRFSSQVSTQHPHALLLEIQGSLGLFGPWPRFEARLREELALLGFRHRIVAAPNPVAARALANAHDGLAVAGLEPMRHALGQLPVQRAGFAPEVATAFQRMGLRTLRQVLALPRDGIARRFPAEVLRHLDALMGECDTVLDWYRPPDRFAMRIELGYEVESSQALLFPLRRLTADLAAFLAGRDGGVQRFALHLEHEGRADTVVPVGLLAPERDAALLFELARGRLEQAQTPAPVRAIVLVADQLPAFVPAHRELFDERPQQAMPWEQLRERLRARLGENAVHGLCAHEDHRPEQAWRVGPAPQPKRSSPAPLPAAMSLRPGWLLAKPIPLRGAAPRLEGDAERIESGWWDGFDIRRDYYVARLQTGQRAWVYRPVGAEGGYWLHGWFA